MVEIDSFLRPELAQVVPCGCDGALQMPLKLQTAPSTLANSLEF